MRHTPFAALAIVVVVVIGGCVATSSQMVNDKGQSVNCGAWGLGIIGAPAALISTQNCISKYEAAGFREAGSPPVQSPSNSPQSPIATPTTMSSRDGSFKITLPAGWIQSPPSSPSQQLFAKNPSIDSGLVMTSVKTSDVQDWEAYAESFRAKMLATLTQSSSSDVRKVKVNGFDALQADISGTEKNGLRLHYLGTFIKTDKQLISLLTWCVESQFSTNRANFEALPSGLQL